MPYRILALDGGGVRGIVTASILREIDARWPDMLERVDLIAGTSAGAINAIGLALGLTPTRLVTVFEVSVRKIFQTDALREAGKLWGLTGAKYDTQARKDALSESIPPDVTLGNLARRVLVPAFQLDSALEHPRSEEPRNRSWKPKFFHNYPTDNGGKPNPMLDQSALDIILRSSAAPIFFPVCDGFVDGGVVANNPALCALGQAIQPNTGAHQIGDVVLLSIGTGGRPRYVRAVDQNWGLKQWGLRLVDMILDSGTELADYQCSQLLGSERYRRIQPVLPSDIAPDDVGAIPTLLATTQSEAVHEEVTHCVEWLKESGW